jgi:hypothetical protein
MSFALASISRRTAARDFGFSNPAFCSMTISMTEEKPDRPAPKTAAEKRAERLRAELRANLARRKLQARARREGAEDDRPGNLLAADEPKVS